MNARLSHVAIFVPDFGVACRFYAGLAGSETIRLVDVPEFRVRSAFVMLGERVYVEVVELPDGEPLAVLGESQGHGQQLLAMECDDLAATIEALRAEGVDVTDLPPTKTLPFPRGWVKRSARGDCSLELCPAGAVTDLIARSQQVRVDDLAPPDTSAR